MTTDAMTFDSTFDDNNGITQKQTDYASDLQSDCIELEPTMKTKIDYAKNSKVPETKDEMSLRIQKLKVLKQKMQDPTPEQITALNSFGTKRTYATKESATVDLKVITDPLFLKNNTILSVSYILKRFEKTLHSAVAKLIFETKKDGDNETITNVRRKDKDGNPLEKITVNGTDLLILVQNSK